MPACTFHPCASSYGCRQSQAVSMFAVKASWWSPQGRGGVCKPRQPSRAIRGSTCPIDCALPHPIPAHPHTPCNPPVSQLGRGAAAGHVLGGCSVRRHHGPLHMDRVLLSSVGTRRGCTATQQMLFLAMPSSCTRQGSGASGFPEQLRMTRCQRAPRRGDGDQVAWECSTVCILCRYPCRCVVLA